MSSEAKRTLRVWSFPAFMMLLAVGVVINTFLLVPVLIRQSDQASAGNDARRRQCATAPINDKEQRWFLEHGVITAAELRVYQRTAPSRGECVASANQK